MKNVESVIIPALAMVFVVIATVYLSYLVPKGTLFYVYYSDENADAFVKSSGYVDSIVNSEGNYATVLVEDFTKIDSLKATGAIIFNTTKGSSCLSP